MTPAVSVIIPVYNVEKHLKTCMESVLEQTFQDTEIILVNDGSTDQSADIINEFKQKYPSIKVVNQENKGLSAARNAGLEVCTGDYILFVDSDDFLKTDMIEKMYTSAIEHQADAVICKYNTLHENGTVSLQAVDLPENKIIDGETAVNMFLKGRLTGHAWNKLIKKSIFTANQIQFPVGKVFEDAPTTTSLLNKCQRISFVNEGLYFYVKHPHSITGSIQFKAVLDHFFIFDHLKKQEFRYSADNYLLFLITQLCYNNSLLIKAKKIKAEEKLLYNEIFSGIIRPAKAQVFFSTKLSLKNKFVFLLLATRMYPKWLEFKFKT